MFVILNANIMLTSDKHNAYTMPHNPFVLIHAYNTSLLQAGYYYFPPKAGKYINGLSASHSVSHSVALSQKSMKALRDYVSGFSGYNF